VAVIPEALIAADPIVARAWSEKTSAGRTRPEEPYSAMSVLAEIVVRQPGLPVDSRFFAVLEAELVGGDAEQRNLLIVGLIEDIQNILLHEGWDIAEWEPRLGDQTLTAWRAVAALWSGQLSPQAFNSIVDG
jgi:hypothetical protein